jgi:hypothetical protein
MTYTETFRAIEEIRRANPRLVLFATGVDVEWVRKAEEALGVRFSPSFDHYLQHYGGATIGGEIINGLLGIESEEACGPDIVYNTLLDRESRGIDASLIVLVDNDGDEFFYLDTARIDDDGENPVLRELIEAKGERPEYASSFAEFLLKRIEFCLSGR